MTDPLCTGLSSPSPGQEKQEGRGREASGLPTNIPAGSHPGAEAHPPAPSPPPRTHPYTCPFAAHSRPQSCKLTAQRLRHPPPGTRLHGPAPCPATSSPTKHTPGSGRGHKLLDGARPTDDARGCWGEGPAAGMRRPNRGLLQTGRGVRPGGSEPRSPEPCGERHANPAQIKICKSLEGSWLFPVLTQLLQPCRDASARSACQGARSHRLQAPDLPRRSPSSCAWRPDNPAGLVPWHCPTKRGVLWAPGRMPLLPSFSWARAGRAGGARRAGHAPGHVLGAAGARP